MAGWGDLVVVDLVVVVTTAGVAEKVAAVGWVAAGTATGGTGRSAADWSAISSTDFQHHNWSSGSGSWLILHFARTEHHPNSRLLVSSSMTAMTPRRAPARTPPTSRPLGGRHT